MGSVAEGLVGGVTTAAKANDRASCKAKRAALGIYDFKIAFDTDRSIVVDGNSSRSHSGLQTKREHVRCANVLSRVRRLYQELKEAARTSSAASLISCSFPVRTS